MNLFSFLKPVEDRQRELRIKISNTRAAIIEANRALSLCEKLQKTLPAKIESVRAQAAGTPIIGSFSAIEDSFSHREEFSRQRRAVVALERLASELPAIRSFWEKRSRDLSA